MSNVDVVIPCYNYAHYLEQCVRSVLNQRDVNVRILIVDDKSTDDTPSVCARLAASDARVSYRRNENNLGLVGTANVGIMGWASAEYYTLISADDALAPGSLARATQVLSAHPEAGLVIGKAFIINEGSLPTHFPGEQSATYQIVSGNAFLRRNFEAGNPAPSSSVVLRTAMQLRLGGYHPAMKHTSDMEMWMRFAIHGPVALIRDVQSFYRWHNSNMTLGFDLIRDREERIKTCDAVYKAGGDENPYFVQMRAAMKERFAREAYWFACDALESGNNEEMKRCLAFAQQCDPSIGGKPIAWRFRVKRLLGPVLSKGMRGAMNEGKRALGAQEHPWFTPNAELGWFPSSDELGEAPLAEGVAA
jgi:glycosyltransferase involved in cell wall biosynthesis